MSWKTSHKSPRPNALKPQSDSSFGFCRCIRHRLWLNLPAGCHEHHTEQHDTLRIATHTRRPNCRAMESVNHSDRREPWSIETVASWDILSFATSKKKCNHNITIFHDKKIKHVTHEIIKRIPVLVWQQCRVTAGLERWAYSALSMATWRSTASKFLLRCSKWVLKRIRTASTPWCNTFDPTLLINRHIFNFPRQMCWQLLSVFPCAALRNSELQSATECCDAGKNRRAKWVLQLLKNLKTRKKKKMTPSYVFTVVRCIWISCCCDTVWHSSPQFQVVFDILWNSSPQQGKLGQGR